MNRLYFRALDIFFSLMGMLFLSPIFLLVVTIGYFDNGSPVFRQKRVGKNKNAFILYKFRTMKAGTRSVATHLASPLSVTRFGALLRRSKLDELPQLINVFMGDMSIVGPRPCLFNQRLLIKEREQRGVFDVLPGITGLAQINNIDMSDPRRLAEWDSQMIGQFTHYAYFSYVIQTILGKGSGDAVKINKG